MVLFLSCLQVSLICIKLEVSRTKLSGRHVGVLYNFQVWLLPRCSAVLDLYV